MKLALLAARMPPAHDGVGDHADMLARALADAGHEVTALTAGEAVPPAVYRLEIAGASWGAAATARAIATLRAQRPAALVVEYTPFLYGARSQTPLAILLAARALRIRTVAIVHEAFHRDAAATGSRWKADVLAARDAVTLGCADTLAVPSAARADALAARRPALAERIAIVPIGANVEPPHGYRRAAQRPATLIAFGVVMPRRRLEYAVNALAHLTRAGADVRLEIIGRVHDRAYASAIAALAERSGIAHRVRWRGELAPAAISATLRTATAAIHTAREGSIASSGSLLALLAHGVPTVALRTRNDDAIFSGAIHLADDAATLAAALHALVREPHSADGLTRASIACYAASFAWARVADRLLDALQIGCTDARLATA